MTRDRRILQTALSIVSGAVVGFNLGFYGPWLVAMVRNDDPIHRGHYVEWGQTLAVIVPIALAGSLGLLAWYGRSRPFRMTIHALAVVGIAWQLYIHFGQ
jgi:hypothetical protein